MGKIDWKHSKKASFLTQRMYAMCLFCMSQLFTHGRTQHVVFIPFKIMSLIRFLL